MAKWKAVLGVVLIFGAGALAGAVGATWYLKAKYPFLGSKSRDKVAYIMKRFTRNLDLDRGQQARIEKLIRDDFEKNRPLLEKRRQEARQQRERLMEEIKKELTQEQKDRLDQIMEKFRQRKKEKETKK